MRVAAEERELAELEAAEAADDEQDGSPVGRFIEGLLPGFLRGDRDVRPDEAGADAGNAAEDEARERRRARLEELRQRKAEREGVFVPAEE